MTTRFIDRLIDRNEDPNRIKQSGEVFTPQELVKQILDKLPKEVFEDPSKTFLDPAAGDGQFLVEVVKRKRKHLLKTPRIPNGMDMDTYTRDVLPNQVLRTVYGVDIMEDNVWHCRARVLMAAHGGQYSVPTGYLKDASKREIFLMYLLDVLTGSDINYDVVSNSLRPFPKATRCVEFMLTAYSDDKITKESVRAEYQRLMNPNTPGTPWKHYNLQGRPQSTRRVTHNIVCANSLTEWDFENWRSLIDKKQAPIKTQEEVIDDILGF